MCHVLRLCRGIDVVRNKIKMFAQKKVTLPPGRHKIVILDEADRCEKGQRLLCPCMCSVTPVAHAHALVAHIHAA